MIVEFCVIIEHTVTWMTKERNRFSFLVNLKCLLAFVSYGFTSI